MTMHLVRGMTSLNTRKRAAKIDMAQMESDFRAYNKDLRQRGLASMQFKTVEDFIDYRLGRGKKVTTAVGKTLTSSKPFVRETVHIPSLKDTGGSATKKEAPRYSGEYLVGIATMHKSNMVPVGRDDSPVNYSTMRRS